MFIMRYVILTFIFSCLFQITSAQKVIQPSAEPFFINYTLQDGLSSNLVSLVFKDSKGFIWIGTQNGLNRYDAYDFKLYLHDPSDTNSISNNDIKDIAEDEHQNLWVATYFGLNYYNRKKDKFKHYFHKKNDPYTLPSNYLKCVFIDEDNEVWIGTEKGLCKYDKENDRIQRFPFLENKNLSIKDINKGNGDYLWISSWGHGLCRFDKKEHTFKQFIPHDNQRNIRDSIIISHIIADNGIILLSTISGKVYRFNTNNESFSFPRKTNATISKNIIHNHVALYKSKDDKLWIGVEHLLYEYFPGNDSLSLFANNIHSPIKKDKCIIGSIYEDIQDIIWVSTSFGLFKYSPLGNMFSDNFYICEQQGEKTKDYNKVIYVDSVGKTWIGTFGNGLKILNKERSKYIRLKSTGENPITSNYISVISHVGEDQLWFGTTKGITIINEKTQKINRQLMNKINTPGHLTHPVIYDIHEDPRGMIWIATQEGMDSYNPKTNTFKHYQQDTTFSYYKVRKINESPNGILWFSTYYGLYAYNPYTKKSVEYLKDYKNPNSLSDNNVYCTYPMSDSTVWIGTQNGLNLLNPITNEFKHFYKKDGLSNNLVKNIIGNHPDRIWLHCESEISMLDIKNMQFYNYGRKEGLIINRQCSYISPQEEIFLGGRNKGFYAFYPENIFHNTYINTPVYITGLKIYNKPVQLKNKKSPLKYNITETKKITLEPQHNIVTFEFSALNYLNSSQQRYVYKLEGYDKKWIHSDVSSRSATYTQLPPGNYVFHVKKINDKGIYDKGTTLSVKVLPPWYRSPFAKIIYLLIFGLMILGAFKVIAYRNKNKIAKVKTAKQHEIDQLKIRFFMNVSHEFSTILSLILGPVKRLKQQMKDLKNNQAKESLSLIERMSEKLKRLVNQLMDIRKLDSGSQKLSLNNDDLVPFIKSIYQIFIDIANQRKIKYNFYSQRKKITGWFDSDKLEKIIYNLLSNAFKYTNIGDSISLKINVERDENENEYIIISVQDTGVGIDEKDLNKIFERFYQAHENHQQVAGGIGLGLSLVYELVNLHRGEINVDSTKGKGSVFNVKLPISKALFNKNEILNESQVKQQTSSSSEVVMEEIGSQLLSKNKPQENLPWKSSKNDVLILMVEDNVELQKYIGELLEQRFKVAKAYNGVEAMRIIDNTLPDLIIADVLMPEMDGFEMCKKVKNNPKTSHIPVILLTARKQNEDQIKGFKAGADAYITKPFDLDLLLIRIQNLLSSRKLLKDKFHKNLLSNKAEKKTLTTANEEFMYKLMGIIEKNINNPSLSINDLVLEMNMGRTNLFNKVKSITGISVNELIRKIRLNRAALLLQTKKYTVGQVTQMTGFRNSSYFIKCFKEQFDQYPSKYMKHS